MIYAISQISGKQFIIQPNQWYDIDFVQSAKVGDTVLLQKILFLRHQNYIQLGNPFLSSCKIFGTILNHVTHKKLMVIKTKVKKHYTRTRGHRQKYTRIKISNFEN